MPFEVVNGVGRGMGVLDEGGDRRTGRGSFGSEFGASHCLRQWGRQRALPKLLLRGLILDRIAAIARCGLSLQRGVVSLRLCVGHTGEPRWRIWGTLGEAPPFCLNTEKCLNKNGPF